MNSEELCREVATKVMGAIGYCNLELTGNDALRVLKAMESKGYTYLLASDGGQHNAQFWQSWVNRDQQVSKCMANVSADNLPEAVFLAALKAVGHE